MESTLRELKKSLQHHGSMGLSDMLMNIDGDMYGGYVVICAQGLS